MELAADLPGECDHVATRRPDRGAIAPVAKADAPRLATIGAHDVKLRRPRAVAFKDDLATIGAVAGRGLDRGGIGQRPLRARSRVHLVDVGIAALFQRIQDPAPVRRETRRKAHRALLHAANLAHPKRVHIHHHRLREAAGIAGIKQPRAIGRKARLQHQRRIVGQEFHIGAIVIHDPDALAARVLGTAFLHESHAAVEIGAFAGQARIDLIGGLVRGAAPVAGAGVELHAVAQRLAGKDVEQAELDDDLAALDADGAGDQRLGVDRLPVLIGHRRIEAFRPGNMGAGGDFAKQPGAAEIGGDQALHLRQIFAGAPLVMEGGDGKGHRLDHAIGDLDSQRAVLRRRRRGQSKPGKGHHRSQKKVTQHLSLSSGLAAGYRVTRKVSMGSTISPAHHRWH